VGLKTSELWAFLDTVLEFIDSTIKANKKENGLYHSYNLINFKPDGIAVNYLTDMLEGQVSLLSAGLLSPSESLEVLNSLRNSGMYRADQNSYTLYPDKELPAFLDKNNIPDEKVKASAFLTNQLKTGNTSIVEKDKNGKVHYNGTICNANQLKVLLTAKNELSAKEIEDICNDYVDVFQHREFTGRSGTFFKYEGLGSIYWHMVSKLLLVTQEIYFDAIKSGESASVIESLGMHYYNIKAGLGVTKNPADYGAFPTDPYSHTPGFAGVQQPGMTGQVKEDFISRFGELGLMVNKGIISFKPVLLRKAEFINGASLKYTYCGVPVEYRIAEKEGSEVVLADGSKEHLANLELSSPLSKDIFSRNGKVKNLIVSFVNSRITN
jgi:hypothetical protein